MGALHPTWPASSCTHMRRDEEEAWAHDWNQPERGPWPEVVDESVLARPAAFGALVPARAAELGITHLLLPEGFGARGLGPLAPVRMGPGEGERHRRADGEGPAEVLWVSIDELERGLTRALELGVRGVVLDDGQGEGEAAAHRAVPAARAALGSEVALGWRGSDQRGLGVASAMAAVELGVERVHGAAFDWGLGTGAAPLDQILLNLALERPDAAPDGIGALAEHFVALAHALEHTIPPGYPLLGQDAFRTATGVHAAAIAKALERGALDLADAVYSSVPARRFGLAQRVEVGPMSGMANVRWWCAERGVAFETERARAVLERAKASDRILDDEEIRAVLLGGAEEG